jgi:predicted HAD superfamily Cof-like phosphohydrolase
MSRRLMQVRHFHKAYGLTSNKKPTLPDDRVMQLRVNLVEDEVKEFEEGALKADLANVIKELCDIDYVAYGAAATYGFKDIGRIHDRIVYRGLKGRGPHMPDDEAVAISILTLKMASQSFRNATATKDLEKIKEAITGILNATLLVGALFRVGLKPYFEEVHRSNMTKLWPEEPRIRYRADGKVEKPPTYSKADIKSILLKELGLA